MCMPPTRSLRNHQWPAHTYLPSERSERYYGHLEVQKIARREVLLEPGRANEALREDLWAFLSAEKGFCEELICVLWCKQRSPKGTLSAPMAKLRARLPTLTIFWSLRSEKMGALTTYWGKRSFRTGSMTPILCPPTSRRGTMRIYGRVARTFEIGWETDWTSRNCTILRLSWNFFSLNAVLGNFIS
jgi:hypothetical protein